MKVYKRKIRRRRRREETREEKGVSLKIDEMCLVKAFQNRKCYQGMNHEQEREEENESIDQTNIFRRILWTSICHLLSLNNVA